MNSYQLYVDFNQSINSYLLIYSAALVAGIMLAFCWWKFFYPTPFAKGLFFSLLIGGLLLSIAATNYRITNTKAIQDALPVFEQDQRSFLHKQVEHISGAPDRFNRLLQIWSVCIATCCVLAFLLRKRPLVVGICTGLIICCAASLLLDYVGYRRGLPYQAALTQIASLEP
jgi:hypothetical protein